MIPQWYKPQRPSPVIFLTSLVDLAKESASYVVLFIAASLLGKNMETAGKPGRFKYYMLGLLIAMVLFKFQKLLAWFFTRYWVEEDKVILTRGVFVKRRIELPFTRIQTIQIKQNLLHRLTQTCSLIMDTAGSSTPEFEVEAIKLTTALELEQWLKTNKQVAANLPDTTGSVIPLPSAASVQHMDAMDIIKLSISENHLRSLVIIIAFIAGKMHELADELGLYKNDTIDNQMDKLQPGMAAISALIITSLLMAIAFSAVQVIFRYFNYTVRLQQNAYQMEWGLFTRHQKTMPLSKLEYLTWSANWLRSKMNLLILRLHSLSEPLTAQDLQLKVPVTDREKLEQLVAPYHNIPWKLQTLAMYGIQQVCWWRRLIIIGLPITLTAMAALYWARLQVWWIPALWLIYFGAAQWVFVKKYIVNLFENTIWITKGIWGQNHLFIQYNKILHVSIHSSPWQRRHGYADLSLHLPGKVWKIPYLKEEEAKLLADYLLYHIEQIHSQN